MPNCEYLDVVSLLMPFNRDIHWDSLAHHITSTMVAVLLCRRTSGDCRCAHRQAVMCCCTIHATIWAAIRLPYVCHSPELQVISSTSGYSHSGTATNQLCRS